MKIDIDKKTLFSFIILIYLLGTLTGIILMKQSQLVVLEQKQQIEIERDAYKNVLKEKINE